MADGDDLILGTENLASERTSLEKTAGFFPALDLFNNHGVALLAIGGASSVHGSTAAGEAISAHSARAPGVYATSVESAGVLGDSRSSSGVSGSSDTGSGVSGESTSGPGVLGRCARGAGVRGDTDTGIGVRHGHRNRGSRHRAAARGTRRQI